MPRILCTLCAIAVIGSTLCSAEERTYPRVNTATDYTVDAQWPKKPTQFTWGFVPGITVDKSDQVYVFNRGKPAVQVYSTDGKLLRTWGDEIKEAHHIKIGPDGNVWIADIGRHVVEQYTPEGRRLRTIGTEGRPGCDKSHLNMPTDTAITPEGDVFISDGYGNNRIVHFDKEGRFVKEWGVLGSGPNQFSIPHAIAIDSRGRLYVADRNNVRVVVYDQSGKQLDEWANIITPWGFWVTPEDDIWVCGSSPMQWRTSDKALGCPPKDQVFMKFNSEGKLKQLFTLPKGIDGMERPGEVNWVHALAFDSKGNMYVGDINGKRAQKFVVKKP